MNSLMQDTHIICFAVRCAAKFVTISLQAVQLGSHGFEVKSRSTLVPFDYVPRVRVVDALL